MKKAEVDDDGEKKAKVAAQMREIRPTRRSN